jgi:hypothetical protein
MNASASGSRSFSDSLTPVALQCRLGAGCDRGINLSIARGQRLQSRHAARKRRTVSWLVLVVVSVMYTGRLTDAACLQLEQRACLILFFRWDLGHDVPLYTVRQSCLSAATTLHSRQLMCALCQ